MTLSIAPAVPSDAQLVLDLVKELAEYEKLSHDVVATVDDVRSSLFGDKPSAECLIARVDGVPVGFAIFFHNYSTFLARRGIYLEDLFIRPAHRGSGYGRALLAEIARIAIDRKCGRLEWAVLDWNAPAIAFYEKLGAREMKEWRLHRLTGEGLEALARETERSSRPR
jgi:GNAT superfamily N-acetyltransferase